MARQVEDLQEVDLLEIESLGRLKHVNLLGPWAGGSPSRVRHDNLLGRKQKKIFSVSILNLHTI